MDIIVQYGEGWDGGGQELEGLCVNVMFLYTRLKKIDLYPTFPWNGISCSKSQYIATSRFIKEVLGPQVRITPQIVVIYILVYIGNKDLMF